MYDNLSLQHKLRDCIWGNEILFLNYLETRVADLDMHRQPCAQVNNFHAIPWGIQEKKKVEDKRGLICGYNGV